MAKILNFPSLAKVIRLFAWNENPKPDAPFNIFDEHDFVVRRCREIMEREARLREDKEKAFRLRVLTGGEGIR